MRATGGRPASPTRRDSAPETTRPARDTTTAAWGCDGASRCSADRSSRRRRHPRSAARTHRLSRAGHGRRGCPCFTRAERADGLVEALGDLLSEPLADPFAPEVIAVPTRGMERWLTQRCPRGCGVTAGRLDGICANVDFPSPRRLVADAVAAASGVAPDADPWLVEHVVWPLLDVVEDCLGEPWLASLAAHPRRRGARRVAARAAAERRAPYRRAVRPLLPLLTRCTGRRWCARGLPGGMSTARAGRCPTRRCGRPSCGGGCVRASGSTAPPSGSGRVRAPARGAGPGGAASAAVAVRPHAPARRGRLAVLRALAAARDVHLFLLHPSPVLWEEIAAARAGLPPSCAAPTT